VREPGPDRPVSRFVVDGMLGRLAHWLRAMGYDTLYPKGADDRRLLQMADGEERVLLTRDVRLARSAGARGCLIRAEDVEGQLAEAVAALGLGARPVEWLSRCLECNVRLERRPPDAVRDAVPPRVLGAHREFRACPACARVYWPGSHADAMVARLERLLGPAGES
jgi:uncharacterized protein with PIN domain